MEKKFKINGEELDEAIAELEKEAEKDIKVEVVEKEEK